MPSKSTPQALPNKQVPLQAAGAAKPGLPSNLRMPPRGRASHRGVPRRTQTSAQVPKRGRLSHGVYMANTAFNDSVTRRAQLSELVQSIVADQNRLARALVDGEYGGTDYADAHVDSEECEKEEEYEADGDEPEAAL